MCGPLRRKCARFTRDANETGSQSEVDVDRLPWESFVFPEALTEKNKKETEMAKGKSDRLRKDAAAVLAAYNCVMKRGGMPTVASLVALIEVPAVSFDPEGLHVDLDDVPFTFQPECGAPLPSTTTAMPTSGTRSTTIRVPGRVLAAFRAEAERTGTPYQTLMNRTLEAAADAMYKISSVSTGKPSSKT